ncbi:YihY/virulence factor BrkB family protein [Tsuneonella mangrovi]|uniref:YihY/virulence factor BrkB family protein n=1 Tax=Tsuneonella mangrovi TaxID=1982042 RepID=UPI000BA27C8B|nr:YihY/virulence factor BrkB family protein [Tsuneonella mangrovi]
MPHRLHIEPEEREVHSLSPEERRRYAVEHPESIRSRIERGDHPWSRPFEIAKRVLVGTYNDGFIHAGNLAYMAMVAIFPFFILGAALFALVGEPGERAASINAVLYALPPMVGNVIGPVAHNVVDARTGWLLWLGGLVGLWTVSSLIETIRDLLRRAYGTPATLAFWQSRLLAFGMIMAAVVLLMLSLLAQVAIGTAEEVIGAYFPRLSTAVTDLQLSRVLPAFGLYGSLYMLFYSLTPAAYRTRRYPKWPGALVTTVWWIAVSIALPPIIRRFFTYNLTYGSLAGIMISLFFFYLVGLGMVVGAELNAALAETPEEEGEKPGAGERDAEDG